MIVRDELRDRNAEVALTERTELVEAFGLDRERGRVPTALTNCGVAGER